MKGSFLRPREKGREGDRLCLILILLVWLAALKCLFNGIYYSAETTIILLAFCFRMSHLWCLRWDSKWTWEHVLTLSFIQFQLFNNQRTYACTFWFWRTKEANSWEVLAMVIYIIHLHSTSPLGVCCNHTAQSALLWKCDFIVSAITGLRHKPLCQEPAGVFALRRIDASTVIKTPTFLSASLNLPVLNTHNFNTHV